MFRDSNCSIVLERMLLILSQLARMAAPSRTASAGSAPARNLMAGNYDRIHKSDFYGPVRKLLSHSDAQVRMRVCNLVGMHLHTQCLLATFVLERSGVRAAMVIETPQTP